MTTKTPKASANKPKILYGENDQAVLTSQAALFEKAGYSVQQAVGRKGVQKALDSESFDVVVLGHTLTRDDRHHLPYMAKKANEDTRVLVLHASGKHPQVDAAIDSRRGGHVILDVIADLLGQKSIQLTAKAPAARTQTAGRL